MQGTNSSVSTEELRLILRTLSHRQLQLATKQTNNISENDIPDASKKGGIFTYDQDGKSVPPRASLIKDRNIISNDEKRRSSLKQKPKYTDATPKFFDSVSTASCSSGFGLSSRKVEMNEPNEGHDETSMLNNSLDLEELLSQTSSQKARSGQITEKYNSVLSGLTEGTGRLSLRSIDNIGEGSEDSSSEDDQNISKYISMGNKIDDGMTDLNRKHSVNIGRRDEDEEWRMEVMEWEREAELEGNLSMVEELRRLSEKHSEQLTNIT